MRINPSHSMSIATIVLLLAGCSNTGGGLGDFGGLGGSPGYSSTAAPIASASTVSGYGVVQSIEMMPRERAGIGLGTIAGGVVGGLLGNQVGSGRGNTAATIAGVAGGALAGREIENRSRQSSPVYRIAVQMNDGTVQSVVQETQPGFRIGDRVRISNGVVERA